MGGIIQRHMSKISGPLLDRLAVHVEVPAIAYQELRGRADAVGSADMRARVADANVPKAGGFRP